jgi:hypothetical protein
LGSRGLQELLSWPVLELRVTDVASNGTIRHEAWGIRWTLSRGRPEAALEQPMSFRDTWNGWLKGLGPLGFELVLMYALGAILMSAFWLYVSLFGS